MLPQTNVLNSPVANHVFAFHNTAFPLANKSLKNLPHHSSEDLLVCGGKKSALWVWTCALVKLGSDSFKLISLLYVLLNLQNLEDQGGRSSLFINM